MNLTTVVDGKHMRLGFTTGTCVVAAATAAIEALEKNETVAVVKVTVPAKVVLTIEVKECRRDHHKAQYAVIKDAGDDPDITDGIEILVTIEKTNTGKIEWKKGTGVGTFTEDSLFGKAGELAINPVPKGEITQLLASHQDKGIAITIDIPKGEAVAKKTFNPRLGIAGGISILGTSGLVRPMSKDAYVATIDIELQALKQRGIEKIYLTPGNYGEEYVKKYFHSTNVVKVSNYFSDALKLAYDLGFKEVVVLGHIGKMAKLAIGILNTHSAVADGRMESIAYYLAKLGAPLELIEEIETALTAQKALILCKEKGYGHITAAMETGIESRIRRYLKAEDLNIRAIIYTMEVGA